MLLAQIFVKLLQPGSQQAFRLSSQDATCNYQSNHSKRTCRHVMTSREAVDTNFCRLVLTNFIINLVIFYSLTENLIQLTVKLYFFFLL